MSIRTYNPSVRVGNWNEDICLKEDMLKDFLDKKEKGELLIQKTHSLYKTILNKVDLSPSYDGFVHFGDLVEIFNPETEVVLSANMPEGRMYEALALESPCPLSGSKQPDPCVRNVFVVASCEDPGERGIIKFGQHFYLKTLPGIGGDLSLQSDRVTFMKCAKKSRRQEILLTEGASFLSAWKVLCYDPQERLETEGLPVPANKKILICHCKTNQCLASLSDFSFRTPFGRENEVVANTYLNSHKAEMPLNHWVFVKDESGSRLPSRASLPSRPVTRASSKNIPTATGVPPSTGAPSTAGEPPASHES